MRDGKRTKNACKDEGWKRDSEIIFNTAKHGVSVMGKYSRMLSIGVTA
jgi:hypothetical protein